ncbi:MAG: hypothetical protein NZ518_08775, partial [Dehalococcoidia bacterium]|nr:hypothetical protein [Dehalococcoidia bacterium]
PPGYETHGSAPATRSSAPAPSGSSAPAAQATPVPTTGIVRQIDRQRRTMPAYLRETPGAQFILVKLHQRTACENAWMGIGFFEVLDVNGKPLDNVIVRSQSGETIIDNRTGTKGPGRVEQWFYRGNWTAWVHKDEHGRDTTSDYAVNMDTVIFAITPEEQAERFCNGVEGLATNHYSYDVTFRKVR